MADTGQAGGVTIAGQGSTGSANGSTPRQAHQAAHTSNTDGGNDGEATTGASQLPSVSAARVQAADAAEVPQEVRVQTSIARTRALLPCSLLMCAR
jgi:hypothetical protein